MLEEIESDGWSGGKVAETATICQCAEELAKSLFDNGLLVDPKIDAIGDSTAKSDLTHWICNPLGVRKARQAVGSQCPVMRL